MNRGSLSFMESHRLSVRMFRTRFTSLGLCIFGCLLWVAPAVCESRAYDTPAWRQEIAHGYLPYHRLVRADFPSNDKVEPNYAMYTSVFYHYNYRYHWATQNGRTVARITEWSVRSGFDRNRSSRKSWFKDLEKLLPHEQGHLDINELYSRRLARMELGKLPIGEGASAGEAAGDLKIKLKALSAKVSRDDQTEQHAYDARTAHGTNQAKQKEATAALQDRLKAAGISYPDRQSSD
jgi:hypothetical protein